jgi:hypothetical protein
MIKHKRANPPRAPTLSGIHHSSFIILHFFGYTPLMDSEIRKQLKPGARVKVTQQIAARDYAWSSDVSGIVVDFQQKQTGSWFAHSKNDKLWLDRLVLRKVDGELTTLNLDEFSRVEIEKDSTPAGESANEKMNESDLPV